MIIAGRLTHVTLRDTKKRVIKSFKHDGLERFFRTGSKAGIQPAHAKKLKARLATLDDAEEPEQMDLAGWNLHPLQGGLAGSWSVKIDGNWRLTFYFEGQHAVLVDYRDYH